MKAEELRDLSDDDLGAKVNELKEALFRMRFKLSLGNTDVVKQLRVVRKDLARVKTLLRERSACTWDHYVSTASGRRPSAFPCMASTTSEVSTTYCVRRNLVANAFRIPLPLTM